MAFTPNQLMGFLQGALYAIHGDYQKVFAAIADPVFDQRFFAAIESPEPHGDCSYEYVWADNLLALRLAIAPLLDDAHGTFLHAVIDTWGIKEVPFSTTVAIAFPVLVEQV